MKKFFYLIFLLFILSGCFHASPSSSVNTNANTEVPMASPTNTPAPKKIPPPSPTAAPKNTPTNKSASFLNIPVPFTSQAPYANWDDLHNEACEEASMIMADAYFNMKTLNKEKAEAEIQKIVEWETKNNYTVDVTAEEVVQILKNYFQLSAYISVRVTAEEIQRELNLGKLIILPAAGRMLGNPNFRRPGPLYHMLVVRGYDGAKKQFITNDPGTRKGEEYRYSYATLLNAVHDWPKQGKGKDDVTEVEMKEGRKVMIVVNQKIFQ